MIDTSSKSLLLKFLQGAFLNVLIRFKGLIYLPLLVNFLSKEEVGSITYWLSLSSLLAGVLLLSLPDSSNKYILQSRDPLPIIGTIQTFALTIGTVCIFAVISFIFFSKAAFETRVLVICVSLLTLAKCLNKTSIFVFQVYQRNKYVLFSQFLIEYGSLVIIVAYLFFSTEREPQAVVMLTVLAYILVGTWLHKLLRNDFPWKITFEPSTFKSLIRTAVYLMPSVYALLIIQNADFIIIERLIGKSTLAEYGFAFSLASIVSGLSMAVTFFWYSSAVVMEIDKLKSLFRKLQSIGLCLSVVVFTFFYLITEPLIRLINNEYAIAAMFILPITMGLYLNVLSQISIGVLYRAGKEHITFGILTFSAAVNIALNIYTIPTFGAIAAAYTTFFTYFLIYFFTLIATIFYFRSGKNLLAG
ncbi:oligosaccharide flippase family protein [Alteromonas sp. ASW11-36]|uniref:Oligosaccharide flippase family protein n=1 Tax=Alteromonas arenosi TaxID=3055817 RepID=A0ABT7T0J6_9ALTE|nr:oligosaccharide flippase family protein [Alteromonas sp. ASW11-36]MDM7861971.1 oligosaccharide flippase family protein [Alteromonas sp. ASW11-36]